MGMIASLLFVFLHCLKNSLIIVSLVIASMFQLNEAQTLAIVEKVCAIKGEKFLILVRGLPGLGKSTLGRTIANAYDGIQLENDMQFMVSGEYVFDPSKLEDAHTATQTEVKNLLAESAPCVVVSNTFTRFWEMQPYEAMGYKYNYTLIVVDLFLAIKRSYLAESAFKNMPVPQLLEFLTNANVHSVPADKLRSMYDRYEFDSDVVTVQYPLVSETNLVANNLATTAGNSIVKLGDSANDFKLLDTGYYLALDLAVPEGASTAHSGVYQRCIEASQQILEVFGLNCGYRMLRKLTVRNAKSHGMCYAMQKQTQLTQQVCTNPHANARSAVKLAAGWTRYHVTILSPGEYKDLQRVDKYKQFLELLSNIEFAPLMSSFASADSDQPKVGYHQGEVTDAPPFPLDTLGLSAGLSEKAYSTSVFLRLDAENPTLQEIGRLRESFGFAGTHLCSGANEAVQESAGVPAVSSTLDLQQVEKCSINDSAVSPEVSTSTLTATSFAAHELWQPHITLAFTHNDVRAVSADTATWDKALGVSQFEALYSRIITAGASVTLATDLDADNTLKTLARLMLYGEVQVSFKENHFDFIVADLKVRRGPMGDDATYRAHPFLQTYLPRGIVYLQHMQCRVIYRGLFSLRKFYGKEGVEDDGIGIGASQMNFKLGKVLENTETILVMEKVNGRAASARFFRYGDRLFVIVGTKLSHAVCWVDTANQRLVLTNATAGDNTAVVAEDDEEEEEGAMETNENSAAEAAPREVQSQDLILSNLNALQMTLKWEKLDALVGWLHGRTLNGEVLDPLEMHLVTLQHHEWVSLCVTDFLLCAAPDTVCSVNRAAVETSEENASVSADTSALVNMRHLAEYTIHVPAYDSHSTVDLSGDSASVKQAKRNLLSQITQQIVHARDSEGKVLYFLDGQGCVLELLKFKTWWYIWRRSIREVISQVFGRFYNKAQRGQPSERDGDTIERERLAGDIEHMEKIASQMDKAGDKAKLSEKFRNRLDEVNSTLNGLRSQLAKLDAKRAGAESDYDVTFTVMELVYKVQRKWPTKFAFFQTELGDRYEEIVEKVIDTAVKYLMWVKVQFKAQRDAFYADFKQVFPVVWERFLVENNVSDMF